MMNFSKFNKWDSPWINIKFIIGLLIIIIVSMMGIIGSYLWDTSQAKAASTPINLPPYWIQDHPIFLPGTMEHPLGTESNGRDILSVILVGTPRSLEVGFIAAGIGMLIGTVLGFISGYFGGYVDSIIKLLTDSFITIPALAVLIVIAAHIDAIDVRSMAILRALFVWPQPTRLIRAQILTLRERGYVILARISGASHFDIMFKEILPNLIPYLAASFTGAVSGAILAATGLEVLGLGPTRLPTLGMTIFYSIRSSAILRDMWWWWGLPIAMLMIIFLSLFLITIGLDEVSNPRIRSSKQ